MTDYIFVKSLNDAPQLLPGFDYQLYTIDEDQTVKFTFKDWVTDVDNPTLRYRVSVPPKKGSIAEINCATNGYVGPAIGFMNTGCVLYTPNPNAYNEIHFDSLTWQAVDSSDASSQLAVIDINVNSVNDLPVSQDGRFSMRQGAAVTVTLTASDVDGNPLQLFITVGPLKGILYQFSQGALDQAGDPVSTNYPALVTDPRNQLVYKPSLNEPGSPFDSFRFAANDGFGLGLSSTIDIDAIENSPPVALPQSVQGIEDTDLTIVLSGFDLDDLVIIPVITFIPLKGSLFQMSGQLISVGSLVGDSLHRVIYRPLPNQNGKDFDSFGFKMQDPDHALSLQDAIVSISIQSVLDLPVSQDININNALEDEYLPIILAISSADIFGTDLSQLLCYIDDIPEHGTLYQNALTKRVNVGDPITAPNTQVLDEQYKVIYLPFQNYNGVDSFSYYTIDTVSGARSNTATVSISVSATPDPPIVYDLDYTTPPLEYLEIHLSATDVDSLQKSITFDIFNLPDPTEGFIFQASDSDPPLPINPFFQRERVSNQNGTIFFRAVNGSIGVQFQYQAQDEFNILSNPGTISINVTALPPSSGGGVSIGVIAGVIAGVCCGLCLCLILFAIWYRRRQRRRHSVAGALVQRKSSKDILEKILLEEHFYIVCALADATQITEADELASALVQLFTANDLVMPLLLLFITKEVRGSTHPSTLFRGNSLASKMMKAYSKMIGLEYLKATLPDLIQEVLAKSGEYEVDRRKLDADANLDENWNKLTDITQRFLESIINSTDACPIQFRRLCNHLYTEVSDHFRDYRNVHTFIGGFLFLRFFCPAIVAPEAYQLVQEAPSMASRRGLVLVSKGLQNLSNGIQFGSKEEYMMPMNQFIVSNLHNVRQFLEKIAVMPDVEIPPIRVELEPHIKAEALEVLHRHLFVNQDQIIEGLAGLNVSDESGRDYLEHLAALDLVLSYSEANTEEITEVLVSDRPLVSAICGSFVKPTDPVDSLITIFEAHGLTVDLLRDLTVHEIQDVRSANMLLRGNSTALRLFKSYVESIGGPYLQQVLGVTVKLVINEPEGFEIDPARVNNPGLLERNLEHLSATCDEFLSNIFAAVNNFPVQIRVICKAVFNAINASTFADSRYLVLGDFVFSRIICPAIVTPHRFGIIDQPPPPDASRALVLITKAIQNLAHNRSIETDEGYMSHLSHFVNKHRDHLHNYLDALIDVSPDAAKDAQSFPITNELLKNSVLSVHQHMKAQEGLIRQILTPDMRETGQIAERLKAILLDLGPPMTTQHMPARAAQSDE